MNPDPTTTGLGWAILRRQLDRVGIRHVAQGEHVASIGAVQWGNQWRGARCQNQLVVCLLIGFTRLAIQDSQRLCFSVNSLHLLLRSHVQTESSPQEFGRRHQQLGAIFDFAADVVGQSAVGKRDILVLFKQGDFGILVHASRACRCRSAAGDATHDGDSQSSCVHGVLP